MSAPIDDLLYGGDDSGDEDMGASVPMRSFSTPLPLTTGLAPLPLAPTGSAPVGGPVTATVATSSKPLPLPATSSATSAAGAMPVAAPAALLSASFPHVASAGQAGAASGTAMGASPAKKAPGSGQQMFQQMFALLKQMLPAEQYATLHSEMRKGNGNDIKSIVDIIKRIAGDAIFSSVIQKMDLTRAFPSNPTNPANAVKAEPTAALSAAPRIPQASTPPSTSSALGASVSAPASGLATSGGTSIASARPSALPIQATAGGVTNALPSATAMPIAAPSVLPTAGTATSRFVKQAGMSPGPSPSLVGAGTTPVLKPSGASPMASRPTMAALTSAGMMKTPPNATSAVKPEPTMVAPTSTPPPSTASSSAMKSATASPSSSPSSTKNEALEKIMYAKRLLLHASTCSLEPGICQFKKCDDVRRVFKHSTSCGGANGCTHCEQLKGLVKYHAKECHHSLTEHCAIPFCDGLRRAYMSATAALGSAKSSAAASHALAAAARGASGGKGGVMSDDDDDNTPLASAVNKVKKNTGKTKSPKSSTAAKLSGPAGAGANNSKKKSAAVASKVGTPPSANAQAAAGPGSISTAGASSMGGLGANAAANKGGNAVTANMTLEYGRLLQLILHVQKCTTSACPVGMECAEAKSLLQQVNSPNAPVRARTYKQVYAHYKVCLSKNNTSTCPMCKIGLRPILPVATTGPATTTTTTSSPTRPTSANPAQSPRSQTTSSSKALASGSAGAGGAATSASPSGSTTLKRTNSMTTPSPRSPSKKPRTGGSKGKSGSDAVAGTISSTAAGASNAALDATGMELVQASVTDIRKEADVLTHTGIDLTAERRTMMGTRTGELLPCKKEEWAETDLFDSPVLSAQMRAISRRCGVTLGAHTTEVMSFALREYLKQVVEEMVQVAKQRSDSCALSLAQLVGPKDGSGAASASEPGAINTSGRMELTATDILRVSCEDSFARLRQEDLSLRSTLLEDAKREEMIERERAKKRKKVDRSKLAQEEKDEAEMDVEELATKDLKERLLREDKEGVTHVDGRVNESISTRFAPSRDDNQVTMEDAGFWLQNQKPYVKPKLFARAEVARIVTKALI